MNFKSIKLKLPKKPKKFSLNIIIDTGISINNLKNILEDHCDYIDMAKIGWGLSLITPQLKKKIEIYKKFQIPVFFGGTLYEYVSNKNLYEEYLKWLKDLDVDTIEISDGTIDIDTKDKLKAIETAKKNHFTVFSEVGKKDPDKIGSPLGWVSQIDQEFDSGSDYIILEGRESGRAGIYRENGEIRSGLLHDILENNKKRINRLIFEAPNKNSQVYMIKNIGIDVNLCNIDINEILSLISLRYGLRSDTFNQ